MVQRQPRHGSVGLGVDGGGLDDGVEVGGDAPVREHHALRVGRGPARELQDRERVRVVTGPVVRVGGRAASRSANDTIGGSPGCGSRNSASAGSTRRARRRRSRSAGGSARRTPRSSPAASAAAARRPRRPSSHTAWIAVTSGRVVGPSRATWAPGPMPRRCSAAAMARASSCSRRHSTASAAVGAGRPDEGDRPGRLGRSLEARQQGGRCRGLRHRELRTSRTPCALLRCVRSTRDTCPAHASRGQGGPGVVEEAGAGEHQIGARGLGRGERLRVVVRPERHDPGAREQRPQAGRPSPACRPRSTTTSSAPAQSAGSRTKRIPGTAAPTFERSMRSSTSPQAVMCGGGSLTRR